MCCRFTRVYTWRELVRLYRLTDRAPPSNLQPRDMWKLAVIIQSLPLPALATEYRHSL
jgi:hypothetical protein